MGRKLQLYTHWPHLSFITFLFSLLPVNMAGAALDVTVHGWLKSHNEMRTIHDAPKVVWSESLAKSAQSWADTCPRSHSNTKYGENIFKATYAMDVQTVVQYWYSEEEFYRYDSPGFSLSTGHFTQIIWKNTEEIGCGYTAKCHGKMKNIWVCHYNPPGNYRKKFKDNVLPPLSP